MKKPTGSILGTILLTVFLDLVGFSIIFPLFPDMLEYYLAKEPEGSSLHALIVSLESLSGKPAGPEARAAATVLFGGLLGSLYSLLQFLAAPVWGALSDRHGRRYILLITVAGTALSYALWVSADAFVLLIASRFLGGAMAGNLSVATAAVADVTDSSSRAKGMGLIGAAFGVGFIVGPVLGAFLSRWNVVESLGFVPGINDFSGPALVALVLSLVNLAFVWRILPETLNLADGQSDTHAKRPMNPLTLFSPSPFAGVNLTNLVYFVYIAAFAGMEFTLTFLAKDRFGYDAYQNGRLFLFIGIVIVVIQGGVVRRLTPRYGERNVTMGGLGMIVPGLFIVGLTNGELWLYVGLFLLACGSSLATPSLTALVSLYAPADRQGEVLGIFRSVGSLARAAAPIVASLVYWRYGSQWPYLGSAVALLIPIALAVRLPAPPKPASS